MFWQPRERRWEGRGTLCLGALQEQSRLSAFQGGMGTLGLEVQRGHNPSGSPRARGYTPGRFDFSGTWVQDTGVFLPSAQACKEILMSTVQRCLHQLCILQLLQLPGMPRRGGQPSWQAPHVIYVTGRGRGGCLVHCACLKGLKVFS